MSRKNLETIVLILGLVVLGAAVFFIFIRQQTMGSIFVTNLIISFGFLIYVVYSIMATNNLNREVRQRDNHISSLKEEITKKGKLLDERQARISALEKDVAEKDEALESSRTAVADLEQQLKAHQTPKAGKKR